MSFSKAAFYLVAGALLVPCVGTVSALRLNAWAQPAAPEAQIKAAWEKVLADSVELEATNPQGAITRYQQFFEETGYRSPAVGVQISLRIARIYQFEFRNYDKAIEIYNWALSLYKDQPTAIGLQKGRLTAIEAQNKVENVEGNKTTGSTTGAAPLAVPIPRPAGGASLGVNIGKPNKTGRLGVGVGPPTNTGVGVGANPFSPSKSDNVQLGINLPPTVGVTQPVSISAPAPLGTALGWNPGPQRCVTALTQQPNGMLWVATEDSGVWRYDPAVVQFKNRWTQFTVKDGLADESAYALAVDQKGRVWAGTLNHGVSVWNGREWKNYGVLDGPLGERVFDIAVCPTDGDVWIATNAGLTRYSQQKDSWSYLTRADGLPSDQVQAIAFDKEGNIVLGTQCDGVALAQAADGYKTWRVVQGPDKMPLTATGVGLPSSLINDVLVGSDGTIYAATTTGLAWSSDGGAKWSYVRGQDYADKVRGLYGGAPAGWKEGAGAVLAEDYVSCLAQGEAGQLWIGHWNAGSEMAGMQSGPKGLAVKAVSNRKGSGFVRAMLPRDKGALLLARYDEGLSYGSAATEGNDEAPSAAVKPKTGVADLTVRLPAIAIAAKAAIAVGTTTLPTAAKTPILPAASLPSAAKAPTLDDLKSLVQQVNTPQKTIQAGEGYYETEDWRTQGDWVGRYGTRYAILCASGAPLNHYVINDPSYEVKGFMGPGFAPNSLRHWIHWLKTDNPHVLYNPLIGHRREAEWDDNGEAMSMSIEGPDVWAKVVVPAGTHRLSAYFFNKDGHDDLNNLRDYLLELKQGSAQNVGEAKNLPTQAKTRIRDFWGGNYKRFVVKGPGTFWLRIERNNSFNTIVSGIFLDKIDGDPTEYETRRSAWLGSSRYEVEEQAPAVLIDNASIDEKSYLAISLWNALNFKYKNSENHCGQWTARVLCLRQIEEASRSKSKSLSTSRSEKTSTNYEALLKRWRWQMSIWTNADRVEFKDSMNQAYKSLIELNPELARISY